MKTPHTPGPWRVTIHGFHMIKVESKDRVIFDGFHGEEANAQLAAAAPELLEALIELHNYTETSCPEYRRIWTEKEDSLQIKVQTAIDKATGQTT